MTDMCNFADVFVFLDNYYTNGNLKLTATVTFTFFGLGSAITLIGKELYTSHSLDTA